MRKPPPQHDEAKGPKLAKPPDDNDLLQRGELPLDPFEGLTRLDPLPSNVAPIRPGVQIEARLPFLTHERLPTFPVDALPPAVSSFVQQLADSLEVPADLPATLSLAVLAAACQGKYCVQPKRGWTETVNLYAVVALDSGELKTPSYRRVLGPLYQHERELRKAWKTERDRVASQNEGLPRAERVEPPPAPRILVDDATPEALAHVMMEQGERVTLASDEGTAFGIMCGMYNKIPNNGIFLKSHDGGRYTIDRKLSGSIHLEEPLLTVAMAVQPSVIRSLAERPELRGQGLWARFVYSLPRSRVGRRTFETQPVDPMVEEAYRALVLDLARRHFPPAGEKPLPLRFSGPAWLLLRSTLRSLDKGMAPGGSLTGIRDWTSKLSGLLVRLAGLFHAAAHEHPASVEVSEQTVQRALAVGRYFLAHARHVFEVEMTTDLTEQAAQKAWQLIERKGWQEVTVRQLQRLARPLRQKKDAEAALDHLVDRGYLVEAQRAPRQRTAVYRVAPPSPDQDAPEVSSGA